MNTHQNDLNYFNSSEDEDQETEDSQSDSTPSREIIGKHNNSESANRQASTSSTGSLTYSKPLSLSNLCSNQRKSGLNGPDDDTCFTIKLDNKSNMQFKNDFKESLLINNIARL